MEKVNSINCRERHTERESCSLFQELPHPRARPASLGCRGTKGRPRGIHGKGQQPLCSAAEGFRKQLVKCGGLARVPSLSPTAGQMHRESPAAPCSAPSSCFDLPAMKRGEFRWIK